MAGVKTVKVYSGPDGAVYRHESLAGDQYSGLTTSKGNPVRKYYATESGARKWLATMARKREKWIAEMRAAK